jgi:hypothetical protein
VRRLPVFDIRSIPKKPPAACRTVEVEIPRFQRRDSHGEPELNIATERHEAPQRKLVLEVRPDCYPASTIALWLKMEWANLLPPCAAIAFDES